jgi:hypothetical protein
MSIFSSVSLRHFCETENNVRFDLQVGHNNLRYRGPGFLAVVIFRSTPTPSPLSRQKAGPATHRKTEKERQLVDGRGRKRVGVEPNHTTARKPGPLKLLTPLLMYSYAVGNSQLPVFHPFLSDISAKKKI